LYQRHLADEKVQQAADQARLHRLGGKLGAKLGGMHWDATASPALMARWANGGGDGDDQRKESWLLINELMNQNTAVQAMDETAGGSAPLGVGTTPLVAPWMTPQAATPEAPALGGMDKLEGEELEEFRAEREKQARLDMYGSNGPPGPVKIAKLVTMPLVHAVLRIWGKLIDIENFEIITEVLSLTEKQDLVERLGLFNIWNAHKVEKPYTLDVSHREHRDMLGILCNTAKEEKGDEHWDQEWFREPEEKICIENWKLHDLLRKWCNQPKAIPEKGYMWMKYSCDEVRDQIPTGCAPNPAVRAKLHDTICLCGAVRAKTTPLEIELPSSGQFVKFDASGDNMRKHFGIGLEDPATAGKPTGDMVRYNADEEEEDTDEEGGSLAPTKGRRASQVDMVGDLISLKHSTTRKSKIQAVKRKTQANAKLAANVTVTPHGSSPLQEKRKMSTEWQKMQSSIHEGNPKNMSSREMRKTLHRLGSEPDIAKGTMSKLARF
jgi:hypothetical protein